MQKGIFVGFCLLTLSVFGQRPLSTPDTTIVLDEVILYDSDLKKWAFSGVLNHLDTLISNQNSGLASLLSENTAVRIRSYGANGIVSSSIRGANASHTQILWNGLVLNQPTTGQKDLSLLNTFLIDGLTVQSGAMSSITGDGAIGGALYFDNKLQFERKYAAQFRQFYTSYGTNELGIKSLYATNKQSLDIRAITSQSDNAYSYMDPYSFGEQKKLKHAFNKSDAYYLSYAYRFTKYLKAVIRHVDQRMFREIPPTLSENSSQAEMDNSSSISQLQLFYNKGRISSEVNAAYQQSELIYNDSLKSIFSEHKIKRYTLSENVQYEIGKGQWLRWENSIRQDEVLSDSFSVKNNLENRFATSLNYRKIYSKFTFLLGLRQEWREGKLTPSLPSFGLTYFISPKCSASYSISRSFRSPSWNDRFWRSLGNPLLKDEQGWMNNISVAWKTAYENVYMKNSLALYYGEIRNWILWQPSASDGLWRPANVSEVKQTGVEFNSSFKFRLKSLSFAFNNMFSYQLSTDHTSAGRSLSESQLIYVPMVQFNQALHSYYGAWHIYYHHHYESKRFVSTDHEYYLKPYLLAHCGIDYEYAIGDINLAIGIQVNNVFNKDYQLVKDRPMPLRHANINIKITY